MANRSTTRAQAIEPTNAGSAAEANFRTSPLWVEGARPVVPPHGRTVRSEWHHTDLAKYNSVVAHIGTKIAREVADIIWNPPDKNKYETIKKELIHRFGASQINQKMLLEREEIGDRTPSQFLRHMRALAGQAVTDDFLWTLWMNVCHLYLAPSFRRQINRWMTWPTLSTASKKSRP